MDTLLELGGQPRRRGAEPAGEPRGRARRDGGGSGAAGAALVDDRPWPRGVVAAWAVRLGSADYEVVGREGGGRNRLCVCPSRRSSRSRAARGAPRLARGGTRRDAPPPHGHRLVARQGAVEVRGSACLSAPATSIHVCASGGVLPALAAPPPGRARALEGVWTMTTSIC